MKPHTAPNTDPGTSSTSGASKIKGKEKYYHQFKRIMPIYHIVCKFSLSDEHLVPFFSSG